jgi:hypothetical protein
VYQDGKKPLTPVALQVQVRDDAGAVVFERAQAIVNQFTGARSANILLDVPVARLASIC